MKTPIAFFIFNRPLVTSRVFSVIREVRPEQLLIIADGARADKPGEDKKCQEVKNIVSNVDWPCQVFTNYSPENLGCRRRISSGLDWVFERVERAIILEDDCLPEYSFFRYCEELLDRYQYDERIMAISGDNFQAGQQRASYSYYLSRYNHIWGWASWRRAWKHYDLSMSQWPALRDSGWLSTLFDDPVAAAYWTRIFQLAYDGFDTWDYAWVFACWVKQGLVALPNKNLVTNIGFGQDATHTRNHSPLTNLPVETITFPLCHPQEIARNIEADNYTEKTLFSQASQANNLSLSSQKIDTTKVMLNEIHKKILTRPYNPSYYTELSQALEKANYPQAAQRALEQSWSIEWGEQDYVSPGCKLINANPYFPHLTLGDRNPISWPYLRKEVPHNWYVDQRSPYVGFLSRDEAHLLYNIALGFAGKPVLEIGCWMGWSACHLALANVQLDVIDPLLSKPDIYQTVSNSLTAAGVRDRVNLIPGYSPHAVQELAAQKQYPWSLIFIDGNHDRPAPLEDAKTCVQFAATDAAIVFHDLASPEVAEGLEYLRQQGWNTMVYQTMQIMGIAWRGQVRPVRHIPDPRVDWTLPEHLQTFMVSGISDGVMSNDGLGEFQSWLAIVRPYTFLSEARLFSLYRLTKEICLKDIPGNFVECGTCKGGAAALIAATIKRYSQRPRKLYAFDTFEGMPEPTEVDRANGVPANDTGFGSGTLGAPIETNLKVVCQALDVESIVVPVKGLFKETLPRERFNIGDIALLHADGDWYESTIDIFQNLYGQIRLGASIQIDDYGHWEGCRKAIQDLQSQWNVEFNLKPIDYTGVWFQKDSVATPKCDASF